MLDEIASNVQPDSISCKSAGMAECQFCEKDQNSRESCGPWLSRFKPKWPYLTKFISPTNFSALSVCLLLKGWVGGHPDGHLRELMLIVTRFYAEMALKSPLLYKMIFLNKFSKKPLCQKRPARVFQSFPMSRNVITFRPLSHIFLIAHIN